MHTKMPLPASFETRRLLLRPYQPSDATWYYAISLANQEHLRRYESGNAIMTICSLAEAEVVVRRMSEDWANGLCFFLGGFERESGDFVCQVYIGPVSWELPEFTLGYIAEVSHQGHGYVTEAAGAALDMVFEHLHAQRVSLQCDDTNLPSFHVAERLGMLREGHLRQNRRNADGSLSGTYHYGMLRSEWQQRKAGPSHSRPYELR